MPSRANPRLVRREPGFVAGRARNLSGNQHGTLDQETRLTLLRHLEACPGQGPAARRRDFLRFPSRYLDSAPPPEMRMDQNGQVHPPQPPDKPVEAGGVIEMAVTADDDLDVGRVEVKAGHILHHSVGARADIEEDPMLVPLPGDGDQDGEPVLGEQGLWRLPARHLSPRAVGSRTALAVGGRVPGPA